MDAGIPCVSQLPLGTRLVVETSAALDVGLRTAAASVVAASFLPRFVDPRSGREERRTLEHYSALAAQTDAAASFPVPGPLPEVRRSNPGALRFPLRGGGVDALRFDSPFEAVNPEMRQRYGAFRANRVAHAQHWRHDDGPRPTLCVIHGFMSSPYLLNGGFFALPWWFHQGYDVLLYTLPFHGARRERLEPYSGYGCFAYGISVFCEAMAHAVHDFRLFVDYLHGRGVEQVGVTGISLGGYVTALLAAVEPRLAVAIPNVPVADMGRLFPQWAPAGTLLAAGRRIGLYPGDAMDAALEFHSPLTYKPVLPWERRMIITGLGDRLSPPEQSALLWEHWDRCQLSWFPGNHIGHIHRSAYLRQMARFMRHNGFAPKEWLR
ncbi:MAG: hypothetical protein J2P57_17895 [Acidimicrobiaceae bacterium]|nr:hypothetical protein [Acidimicrobiaceae bacterium]